MGGFEFDSPCTLVHDDEDCVVALTFWEWSNEVDSDRFPRSVRRVERMEGCFPQCTMGLVFLARIASIDVSLYVSANRWLPIVA